MKTSTLLILGVLGFLLLKGGFGQTAPQYEQPNGTLASTPFTKITN